MDFSKVEAGRLELRDERVDMAKTIAASVNLLQYRARTAGLSLSVEVPDGLPLLLLDERALKQVLLNLLSNAVKFTPRGGKVSVQAAPGDGGGGPVLVLGTRNRGW